MKLRDLAEIIFTDALVIGFAALLFLQGCTSVQVPKVRHIASQDGSEAVLLTEKPCAGVTGFDIKPEYMPRLRVAVYLFSNGKSPIPGCYLETGPVVEIIYEDQDTMTLPADAIKDGAPVPGRGA